MKSIWKTIFAISLILLCISCKNEPSVSDNDDSNDEASIGSVNIVDTASNIIEEADTTPEITEDTDADPLPSWTLIGSIDAGDSVRDFSLAGNFLYVAGGPDGVSIFALNNPAEPGLVSLIESNDESFYRIRVVRNIAYIAVNHICDGWCAGETVRRFKFYDIMHADSPTLLSSSLIIPIVDFLVDGDYIYSSTQSLYPTETKLQIIDASDPEVPVIESSLDISSPAKVAKNENIVFLSVSGLSGFKGLVGVDVADSSDPTPFFDCGGAAYNVSSYQFAIHEQTGYVPIESEGIQIFNLEDPADIYAVKTILTSSPPHHIEISASYMYVSTDDGVEIYDISEPETPLLFTEIPTSSAAIMTRIHGDLGVVLTDEVLSSDDGVTVVEGKKLRVIIDH